jgi:class 3 adenylate cyclase
LDGVNVAARLEGLAEPGGICVSARVQEDTRGRLRALNLSSAAGERQASPARRGSRRYFLPRDGFKDDSFARQTPRPPRLDLGRPLCR